MTTLPIWPASPVWASMQRTSLWGEFITGFDSRIRQAHTIRSREYFRYSIQGGQFNEVKQSSLHAFVNSIQGQVGLFLFKDPYDYDTGVTVTQPTSTNMVSGDGFFMVDGRGWEFVVDSEFLVINDPASGNLISGTDYVLSGDNGYVTVTKPVSSLWTASFQYFRKCALAQTWTETSAIWNIFASNVIIEEWSPKS